MNFNRAITVGQLMTKDLFTLSPTDSLLKVEAIFKANSFHHIPIVDKANQIIGIISRVDFNKMQDSFTLFNTVNTAEINNSLFKSVLIKDIMVQQVATLHPEDTALIAMGMFKENLFHAIPIVNKQKELLGLLTTYDLLTYAYNEPNYVAELE